MVKSELGQQLIDLARNSKDISDQEFVDALNPMIVKVELDESYKTDRKLKIFDLFTRISNCDARERVKYAKKIARLLK